MNKTIISVLLIGLLAPLTSLNATTSLINISNDETKTIGANTVIIKAGSVYESLTVNTDTMILTVPSGEAVELRAPGIYPAVLENDGGLANCNVLQTRDNQLLINGPRTVTVRPSAFHCDVTNYDTNNTSMLSLVSPTVGAQLTAGSSSQIFWQSAGRVPASVRLRLSLDGGTTYDRTIIESVINNGFYQWTVPEVVTTSAARIKIEGFDSGLVTAVALGDLFTIQGSEPPLEEEEVVVVVDAYNSTSETFNASTISVDKSLTVVTPVSGTITCLANSRIKSRSSSGVYYCGVDGKRYVFPNQKTHDTWYSGFSGVIELSDAELAAVPLGGNVTYRPGVRMVKIQTDPKVYAVAAGGVLRWVKTEAAAERLYGSNWNQMIDDVPDAFFVNYVVGEAIE
ncbi:hypothetical protein KKF05_00355 [Patescibacteria group bacterium]|nr:hypothetical protein [Patescibacteria group bacterium]MBU1029590.1 hypothetical protein [Patescibacteria group bacterium]